MAAYSLLKIEYLEGYCPYTSTELQSLLNCNHLAGMIERKQTSESKSNCYQFCAACFTGLRNLSKDVCEQFRRQLKALPEIERP